MIRISALAGRAVVDLDAAEKLGKIDKIILDPDARLVAGFVVSRGSSLFNPGDDTVLPASAVHAIGPDAVTVHRSAPAAAGTPLDGLPRVSDLVGRKVVSEEGRFLGRVDDVLVDETDGRILGYALDDRDTGLRGMVSPDRPDRKDRQTPYLRADANLRAGEDLIVAPESAVGHDWALLGRSIDEAGRAAPASGPVRWTDTAAGAGATPWVRDPDPMTRSGGDL
jgi:sporulation protein YlmC with PRC-barrel domain